MMNANVLRFGLAIAASVVVVVIWSGMDVAQGERSSTVPATVAPQAAAATDYSAFAKMNPVSD